MAASMTAIRATKASDGRQREQEAPPSERRHALEAKGPGTALRRLKVLILIEWFLPGEQAGGPVGTTRGLIRHLSPRFDFALVCRNRDLGRKLPYESIPADRWLEIDGQRRWYLSSRSERLLGVVRILRSTSYDVLLLNTLFSVNFCLMPLLARRVRLVRRRVLLAPRGQLNPEALVFSAQRKRMFLTFLKLTGSLRGVEWAASTPAEASRIRAVVGRDAVIYLTPNLRVAEPRVEPADQRSDETLRVCFLSRISPMKNLREALRVLEFVRVPVRFDIFGPKEDIGYWRTCEQAIAALPSHVETRWMGAIAHDAVAETLSRYDLFLLPTLGENFGHAIVEALSAGCPVMISDRTPWRGLSEHGAGWDIALGDPVKWAARIDAFAAEPALARRARTAAAQSYAALIGQSAEDVEANARALLGTSIRQR